MKSMRSEAEPLRRAAADDSEIVPITKKEIQNGAYLLHFARAVPYDKAKRYGDERHYVGASRDIMFRVAQHLQGRGSLMTQKALEVGIGFTIAAIFPGAKQQYIESIVTKVGATSFCPLCNEDEYYKWKKNRRRWSDMNPKAQANIRKWQQSRGT